MRLQMSTSQGYYEGMPNSTCPQCLPISIGFHLHLSCTSTLILLSPINSIPEERKNYIQMIGNHHVHCYSFSCSMLWLLVLSVLVNAVHTPLLQFCHLLPITFSKNWSSHDDLLVLVSLSITLFQINYLVPQHNKQFAFWPQPRGNNSLNQKLWRILCSTFLASWTRKASKS